MKKPLLFLLLSLLLAASAWLVESRLLHAGFQYSDILTFKRSFLSVEKILNEEFKDIDSTLVLHDKLQTESDVSLFDEKGICFFILQHNEVVYWTDNRVELQTSTDVLKDKSVVKLSSGWYYCRLKQVGSYQYVGLLLLKTNYPLTNKYIHNTFNSVFNLPAAVHIYFTSIGQRSDVLNSEGQFVFALLFPKGLVFSNGEVFVPLLLYLLAFIGLLLVLQYIVSLQKTNKRKTFVLIGLFLLLLLVRQVLMFMHWPQVLYQTDWFSPKLFAYSDFFPSLGDLAIFTALLLFLLCTFAFRINIKKYNIVRKPLLWVLRVLAVSVFVAFFFYTVWLFYSLLFNSTISFEANRILQISGASIVGMLPVTSYVVMLYLLAEKMFVLFYYRDGYKSFLLTFFAVLAFILGVIVSFQFYYYGLAVLLFAAAVVGSSYFVLVKNIRRNYHVVTVLILVYALFSAYFIQSVSESKRDEEQKVLALRLASRRDPVAENLFAEMRSGLKRDTVILHLLNEKVFRFDLLMPYLRQQYFNGYFEKYDFQLTVCRSNDSLRVSPEDINVPCFSFFESMVSSKGDKLSRSDFYYVNYSNSRISYLGMLRYNTPKCGLTHVYIELDSRLTMQELGYPDLLLDESLSRQQLNKVYSYARYNKGRLLAQSGHFPYNRTLDRYQVVKKEFSTFELKGYTHLVYQANNDNVIVLSRPPSPRIGNVIISFSYLFVFLLLLFNIILFFIFIRKLKLFILLNFEHKIRYSLAGMLLVSLLIVAGASVIYTSSQFKQKHNVLISEKMQSVYRHLSQQLGFEEQKDASLNNLSQENLEVLLRSFSNIFYSDINVYNPSGKLIASSRPEIFDKSFFSPLINREAFDELKENDKSEYVHYESIGSMRFMSAYTPLLNSEGLVIGYLNLPYFAKQSELWEDLYNQLFTLLNFYILLMLMAVSLSVFISRRITQPLRWIQDRFSQIKLGDRTSKIDYKSKDEIGALIEQYNRMVEELNRNMDLLAKSERESAWREMAKQIAHEIKNPLTPMKLSLQHLVRAWNDKVENWDDYLNRVTQTVIEQIDNLTAIANEFSNFAKMPKPNSVQIPISTIINDVMQLYSGSDTSIVYTKHIKTEPIIFADKEQITRVFINLVTNSIQAISPRKKGRITIDLYMNCNDMVRIELADNGMGILPTIGSRLFEPNFTTKSGGMGLGLAIVKNIVENAGGSIYYHSIQDEGTTFTVELPLAK